MSIQLQKPDYVIVYVSDMQRSTAFYRDVLGLPLKFTSPAWTEFQTSSITIALHSIEHTTGTSTTPAQETQPGQATPPAGQAQLGFAVDNLQSLYEKLQAQDVYFSLAPKAQSSGVTLAVLHDPDGLGITLLQR